MSFFSKIEVLSNHLVVKMVTLFMFCLLTLACTEPFDERPILSGSVLYISSDGNRLLEYQFASDITREVLNLSDLGIKANAGSSVGLGFESEGVIYFSGNRLDGMYLSPSMIFVVDLASKAIIDKFPGGGAVFVPERSEYIYFSSPSGDVAKSLLFGRDKNSEVRQVSSYEFSMIRMRPPIYVGDGLIALYDTKDSSTKKIDVVTGTAEKLPVKSECIPRIFDRKNNALVCDTVGENFLQIIDLGDNKVEEVIASKFFSPFDFLDGSQIMLGTLMHATESRSGDTVSLAVLELKDGSSEKILSTPFLSAGYGAIYLSPELQARIKERNPKPEK